MPLVSIVMLAMSRTSSSRPPFADSSMCSDMLAPLKFIVSLPLRPSTVSLPSPGFQTNESSPAPRLTVSFPRPASTESLPALPWIVSAPEPPTMVSSPLPPSIVVGMVSVKTPPDSSMRMVSSPAPPLTSMLVMLARAKLKSAAPLSTSTCTTAGLPACRRTAIVSASAVPDDAQRAVFQLGLLEAVRGVSLRRDERGHAGEGGDGHDESSEEVHVFLLFSNWARCAAHGCVVGRWSARRAPARTVATPLALRAGAERQGEAHGANARRRRAASTPWNPRFQFLYMPGAGRSTRGVGRPAGRARRA